MMRSLATLVLALVAACAPHAANGPTTRSATLAITGVTVIDVGGAPSRAGTTVLVRDGRIQAIGTSDAVAVPRGATVVDGRGKFLIPGLWDAHVHLSFAGPEILPLFVANAVTSVRDVGSRFDSTRAYRARVAAGALVGPRIVTSGPILEGATWMEAAYKIAPPESPIWAASPRVLVAKENI